MLQWIAALEKVARESHYTGKNRFDSFAPIRLNVAAQWLVDGVSPCLSMILTFVSNSHVSVIISGTYLERFCWLGKPYICMIGGCLQVSCWSVDIGHILFWLRRGAPTPTWERSLPT